MRVPARKVDTVSIYRATDSNQIRIADAAARVANVQNDERKKERHRQGLCQCCFYYSTTRLGGAAITSRPCGLCGTDMSFASTCTDIVCYECAISYGLCKHCGGDIDMKHRKKDRGLPAQQPE